MLPISHYNCDSMGILKQRKKYNMQILKSNKNDYINIA